MPAVTMPAHKKGDYLVDYEEKVFEDVKAEPGEKALVTFHTVAFEGSIGLVNMLQALRLQRKGFKTTVLLYGPGVTLGVQRGFPKLGDEPFPGAQNFNNQLAKFMTRRRRDLCLPLRAANALRPRRAFADPRHPADQPARRPRSHSSAPARQRLHAPHLDGVRSCGRNESQRRAAWRRKRWFESPRCRSRRISKRPAAPSRRCSPRSPRPPDKGARLVVFPETFVPWYPYFSFVHPPVVTGAEHIRLYENAVVVPGPVTEAVAALAKRHGIVVVLGVNERDHGSLYNTQLVFDADGRLALKRRKITPTFHERMIWGQGDGAGLTVVDTAVGRIGALACWEHYNPLARYALMAQHEEIHVAQFPGSMVGPIFAEQIEVTIRHHALESGCFVVNATGWLTEEQIAKISPDEKLRKALRGGCMTAIVSPEGAHVVPPLTQGEGILIGRSRHGSHHQAQADDGFGRPLRASRAAQARARRPSRASDGDRDRAGRPPVMNYRPMRVRPMKPTTPSSHADRATDQRVAVLRGSAR